MWAARWEWESYWNSCHNLVTVQIFETSRATLTSHPSSSLAKMFEPKSKLCPAIMDGGGASPLVV